MYQLILQSILGSNFNKRFSDLGPHCDALLGKRFFGILETTVKNEWYENKRRERWDTNLYRIFPYVPYFEQLEAAEIAANEQVVVHNQMWLEDMIERKEQQVKTVLKIYRNWPHSRI